MDIYWLDSRSCRDPNRVGGKAASLGRLASTYPVPPGFCVAAVREAVRSGAAALTPELYAGLVQAYTHLGERCGSPQPPVAVRSSAVGEDGQQASFAGQYETYLNVIGPQAVTVAVLHCLASAQNERAVSYRRSHGYGEDVQVAVVVQQLVQADASAVVFSADPRTGRRDRVVINATWGLGESLVSGTVTPDLYVVDKNSFGIESRQIGDKACMTVPLQQGTQEVAVPRCMRTEAALGDGQIVALARLAVQLEQGQGWPVDLECAFQNGRLYLLQCRPITTLRDN